MFDIGFTEMVVIGIVALIVIGPEQLPKVSRTLGQLSGRARRYANDIKNDIQQEMEMEELKKLGASMKETADAIEVSAQKEINQFQGTTDTASTAISSVSQSEIAKKEAPSTKSPVPSIKSSTFN